MKKAGMILRYKWFLTLVAIAALALAATGVVLAQSQDKAGGQPALTSQSAGFQPIEPGAPKNMNDLLVEVANIVPAFGGMFLDPEANVLFIFLLDPSDKAAVEQAIKDVFGPDRIPPGGIRVLQGQYGIHQLMEWYNPMYMKALTLPGVTATDLHEGKNRLWIGVAKIELKKQVDEELAKLGIPLEAVIFEEFGPVVPANHLTLQSAVRPVENGVQINNPLMVKGTCTLGAITLRSGVLGMVTVHHCSSVKGLVDSDPYYQPVQGANNLIGNETVDPPFFQGGNCPFSRICRNSDSNFSQWADVLNANRGFIARPICSNCGNELRIDHFNPRFRIVAEGISGQGDIVNKVGRTTGWTQGLVTQTCQNVNFEDTEITYLCQDRADFQVQGGDSGAPVFKIQPNDSDVTIVGILWGMLGTYSPIGRVEQDLGPLNTCPVGLSC